MMDIKITLESPDLVVAAQTLADALNNMRFRATFASAQAPATPAGIPPEVREAINTEEGAAAAPDPAPQAVAPAQSPRTDITLEQLRALVNTKIQAGKREAVKALLTEMGVGKVTEIPEERRAEAYEKAGAL